MTIGEDQRIYSYPCIQCTLKDDLIVALKATVKDLREDKQRLVDHHEIISCWTCLDIGTIYDPQSAWCNGCYLGKTSRGRDCQYFGDGRHRKPCPNCREGFTADEVLKRGSKHGK